MKVLLTSNHTYPAGAGEGAGKRVSRWPSGSAHTICDLLARGLAAEGHRVLCHLEGGASEPLPRGVELAAGLDGGADIVHCVSGLPTPEIEALGTPWVTTCHVDPAVHGQPRPAAGERWIFVSKTLARTFGKERFVHNGLDPEAYRFADKAGDYLLFMSSLEWADNKGLDLALEVAADAGLPLLVAGTSRRREVIREVDRRCSQAGARLVGDVRGARKAELLAGARALLFPTQVNEAFGLVMVEALLSGTPVISSDCGACREVISEEVGVVCREHQDYVRATRQVLSISRAHCREWAAERYHYRRMARDYAAEYRRELAGGPAARGSAEGDPAL